MVFFEEHFLLEHYSDLCKLLLLQFVELGWEAGLPWKMQQ
jgi:hypothetical protein